MERPRMTCNDLFFYINDIQIAEIEPGYGSAMLRVGGREVKGGLGNTGVHIRRDVI